MRIRLLSPVQTVLGREHSAAIYVRSVSGVRSLPTTRSILLCLCDWMRKRTFLSYLGKCSEMASLRRNVKMGVRVTGSANGNKHSGFVSHSSRNGPERFLSSKAVIKVKNTHFYLTKSSRVLYGNQILGSTPFERLPLEGNRWGCSTEMRLGVCCWWLLSFPRELPSFHTALTLSGGTT